MSATRVACFETVAGWCGIAWRATGLRRFRLPEASERATLEAMRREGEPGVPPDAIAALIARAQAYFAGAAVDFDDVAIDLSGVEAFTRAALEHIRGVRRGETTTYGAVAAALGAPKEAARAVGQAMGANPVPLVIPCHRVLAAGNRLGGFSGPGGARQKAEMLSLEGARAGWSDPAQGELGL
jgi:methylated-DNA-[protein]-cysteine S-methyltransferase